MKKTWLFLVMWLLLMAPAKHVYGQDASAVGWDLEDDPTQDVVAAIIAAPILGAIFGGVRLLGTNTFRPVISLGLGSDTLISGRLRGDRLR